MTINPVPDLIVDSIYDITPQLLSEKNIRGLLVDLDNTLARYDESEPAEDIVEWVQNIKNNGIQISIISNNSQERVDKFNEKLGLLYNAGKAGKPSKQTYLQMAEFMGLCADEVAAVGDQIYTDVLGGNAAGMYTIMISSKSRTWNVLLALRRTLEMPFINAYNRRLRRAKNA